MAGSWMNDDGLYIEYGTTKTIPNTAGEYLSYGEFRTIEFDIDLTTLTTSPVVQADTTFIPAGVFIDSVQVEATTAATGGTSFSIGLIGNDRTTVASNTGFVAAALLASVDTAGETTTYTGGVSLAGVYVGTTTPSTGYITALAAGTFATGKIRVRIKYHGITPITQ